MATYGHMITIHPWASLTKYTSPTSPWLLTLYTIKTYTVLGGSFDGIDMMDGECLCVLLDLVIQNQHKCAAHASEHIGPGTLEESSGTLILSDLFPTVDCALVHNVSF